MNAIKTRRLIGLFILGCLLFNYPILSIFNRAILIGGVPLLYVYLFAAWAMSCGKLKVRSSPAFA